MKIKNLAITKIEKKEVESSDGVKDMTAVTLRKEEVTVKIQLTGASTEIAEQFIIGEELDISGEIAQQKLEA